LSALPLNQTKQQRAVVRKSTVDVRFRTTSNKLKTSKILKNNKLKKLEQLCHLLAQNNNKNKNLKIE